METAFIRECAFNYHGWIDRERFKTKYGHSNFPDKPNKNEFYYSPQLNDSVDVFFYPNAERYGPPKIPDALISSLKQLVDPPEPNVLQSCDLPAPLPGLYKIFEREKLALSELHSVLMLLQDKQLKVSEKTGVASLATIKKVANDTHEYYGDVSCSEAAGMEFIVSYGWLRLLGNSKLSKQSKTTLVPARKSDKSAADTIKEIWEQWVSNRVHDEFRRINNVKGQNGKGKRFFTPVVTRRQAIITALKECKTNAWINFNEFSNYLFISGAELMVTTAPDYLYLFNPEYGEFYNGSWEGLEMRYLRCFLVEYAATLGLIDVVMIPPEGSREDDDGYGYYDGINEMDCLSRYDGLRFFRLTPLGEYVLGLTDNYQEKKAATPETTLSIQRQGRITFNNEPTPWEQRFISLYADQSKDRVWKLSRQRIMEALQVGGNIDELKSFLLTREDQPFLPEDCESLLKEAQANRDGVKTQGEALIMTCKNQKIAELIMNDKVLSKWCQQLGTQQIVVPKGKEKKFRDSLNTMGIGCS
ncbi:hypothetical protein [Endozoicomonas sp. 4G]|uniref:hypothetical protein n=1 Tax=Endozoicomonas sp. 4G TaxID=2872754 RepID=UPI002078E8D1|nr:hypothetical protein [Endozoicomonas sp. 4G]